jgi:hypothetical protein
VVIQVADDVFFWVYSSGDDNEAGDMMLFRP